MADTDTIELNPEVRDRLLRWGGDGRGEEEIIRELLVQAEQRGRQWSANDYY